LIQLITAKMQIADQAILSKPAGLAKDKAETTGLVQRIMQLLPLE
jgi:hypothetical protein